MRTTAFLSAAICLFSVAEANVQDLTIPHTIRIGQDFVANFTTPIQQPRDQVILWGVSHADARPGEVAGYNNVGVTKLYSDAVPSDRRNYFWQIKNGLQIPEGTYGQGGPLVIQAAIVGYLGAAGNVLISTRYWRVNTTLTGETSVEQIAPIADKSISSVLGY